jgi:outer membrane immunogenic protein
MIRKLMLASASGILTSAVAAICLGETAFAADLPSRAAPPVYVPPPIFTWTGFYAGGQVGYEWGTSSPTATNNGTGAIIGQPDYTPGGVAGGIHSGYNYQINQFVIGYESALNGASYQGSGFNNSGTILHSTNIPFESSIRGRVGMAWDRTLFFAAGGLAICTLQNTSLNNLTGFSDTFNTSRVGWTVGGGVEYALTNHWSVRVEYRYTDFGHINEFEGFSTGGAYSVTKHETDNKVQIGFSYKFDRSPLQMAAGFFRGN